MNTRKAALLAALSIIAAWSTATYGATVVTINLRDHAAGTDISNAYPGVVLQRVQRTPGTNTYTPVFLPALVDTCSSYGPCPEYGPLNTVAGNTANGWYYFNCYSATVLSNGTELDCGFPWSILELTFPDGTDFVEIDSVWNIDTPSIVAYDAAGNEIQTCHAYGGSTTLLPGSPPGCLIAQAFQPGGPARSRSRVQTTSANIARVVFASRYGSTYPTGIQYNLVTPCPESARKEN